jgi:flap endonuclease-1
VGILIGTDFNPDGIRGIGPKTAVKLIREYGSIEKAAENSNLTIEFDIASIRDIFLQPDVTSNYALKWSTPNEDKIVNFLCKEHDFSEDRVRKAVGRMASNPSTAKTTLESYFR